MLTKPEQYLCTHIRKNRLQILIKGLIVFWISVVLQCLTALFQDHKILSLKPFQPVLASLCSSSPLYFIKDFLGVLTVHHFPQPCFYFSDCCLFMEEVRDLFYLLKQYSSICSHNHYLWSHLTASTPCPMLPVSTQKENTRDTFVTANSMAQTSVDRSRADSFARHCYL